MPSPVALDFESFVLQHTSTPPSLPPPPPYQGQSYPQEKISSSSSIVPSPTSSKPSSPRRNLALLSFLAFLVLAIYPFVSGAGWEWEDPSASASASASSLTSSQPTQPKFFLQISVVDPASPPSSSSPSSPPNDLAALPPPPSSFTSHSRSRSRRAFPSFGGGSSEPTLKEEGGEEKDASADSTFPTSFGRWTKEEESALEIPEAVWDVVDHGKFMLMGRPTHHVKAAVEEGEE